MVTRIQLIIFAALMLAGQVAVAETAATANQQNSEDGHYAAIQSAPDVEVTMAARLVSSGAQPGSVLLEGSACNKGNAEFRPRPEVGAVLRLEAVADPLTGSAGENSLISENTILSLRSGECVVFRSVYIPSEVVSGEDCSSEDISEDPAEKYFVVSMVPDDACKKDFESGVDGNPDNNKAIRAVSIPKKWMRLARPSCYEAKSIPLNE